MAQKKLTKKEYIETAYTILKEEGIEAVSIRRIAQEMQCSSASLYRHFNNRGELILFASIVYLRDYLQELKYKEIHVWNDIWEEYIGIWEVFSKHAFKNPKVFDCVFFGEYKEDLTRILKEYDHIFPEDFGELDEYVWEMLGQGDYTVRSYAITKKCVAEGVMTSENAKRLNRLCVYTFQGIFKKVLNENGKNLSVETMVDEVVLCVTELVYFCVQDLLKI